MVRNQEPGAPLPFGVAVAAETVVATAGDYDKDDGMKIVLVNGNMMILGAFDGITVTLGVRIEDLLEAICKYNRAAGN